jgi:hypothetical protein
MIANDVRDPSREHHLAKQDRACCVSAANACFAEVSYRIR